MTKRTKNSPDAAPDAKKRKTSNPTLSSQFAEMKKSYEEVKQMCDHLEALLRQLPTKSGFQAWQKKSKSRWTSSRNSWNDRRPDIIPNHYKQSVGNCWSVAYFRHWYSLMVMHGLDPSVLKIKHIMKGVPASDKSSGHGLANFEAAAKFMKDGGYVEDMILHQKPFGDEGDEQFEKKLESLLANGPVAVHYKTFPSQYMNKGRGLLSSTLAERQRHVFEGFSSNHASYLSGNGVYYVDGESKPYWELFESSGIKWGEHGSIRLARHKAIIIGAVEMKLKSPVRQEEEEEEKESARH